jgi:hypothetical protein
MEDMRRLEVLLVSQQQEWEAKERKRAADMVAEVMVLQQELSDVKQVRHDLPSPCLTGIPQARHDPAGHAGL